MNPQTATIDTTTLIQGFKITNGGSVMEGAGLYIYNSSPILKELLIKENSTLDQYPACGGGIFISNSNSKILKTTISSNFANMFNSLYVYRENGAGIWSSNSTLLLNELNIISNVGNGLFSGW